MEREGWTTQNNEGSGSNRNWLVDFGKLICDYFPYL